VHKKESKEPPTPGVGAGARETEKKGERRKSTEKKKTRKNKEKRGDAKRAT